MVRHIHRRYLLTAGMVLCYDRPRSVTTLVRIRQSSGLPNRASAKKFQEPCVHCRQADVHRVLCVPARLVTGRARRILLLLLRRRVLLSE